MLWSATFQPWNLSCTQSNSESIVALANSLLDKNDFPLGLMTFKTVVVVPAHLDGKIWLQLTPWERNFIKMFNLSAEMYPECVIASWDALVFLLDLQNILIKGPIGKQKKIECLCKLQTSGKNICTAHFKTILNISNSHYEEMIQVLKFLRKL